MSIAKQHCKGHMGIITLFALAKLTRFCDKFNIEKLAQRIST